MSRTTWSALLALFGVYSLAVPLVGYSVPPCLGRLPDGGTSPECIAQWQASMPLFPERLVYALGVPLSVVVIFAAMVGVTLVVHLARRRRSDSSHDIPRR